MLYMPHKFNADRRDKIPKQKQRVTNWSEYNEGLRQRGDLTVWISDDALDLWAAPRRTGLVTVTFRSLNSFMRPFVRKPRGFSRRAMSGGDADCRSR
jgi:hypothetical protein